MFQGVEEQANGGMKPSDTAEELASQSSVINYLISKRADINERDIYGQTPLHYACMRGNEVATRELLQYSQLQLEVFKIVSSVCMDL